ncbi:unnamed protein product [Chironomus riparius]|uniref:Uncharacterized protein n=1 Tax=Chironomus riparius TaxID=315576 RepID=A0A9N9RLI5_9DIPT|nr:unnamed protein product [Chironomus riparius]
MSPSSKNKNPKNKPSKTANNGNKISNYIQRTNNNTLPDKKDSVSEPFSVNDIQMGSNEVPLMVKFVFKCVRTAQALMSLLTNQKSVIPSDSRSISDFSFDPLNPSVRGLNKTSTRNETDSTVIPEITTEVETATVNEDYDTEQPIEDEFNEIPVEDEVEESADENVEGEIEEPAEENVEGEIEEPVDDNVEGEIEEPAEENFEGEIEEPVDDNVEGETEPDETTTTDQPDETNTTVEPDE